MVFSFTSRDYNVEMGPDVNLNQVILLPVCDAECRGMEDMRFVCFKDDGGSMRGYGTYTMSGRIDGENLYILQSDSIRTWDDAVLVEEPQFTWELAPIGNCGSPIEAEAGWLLLAHGVGPMRRYCIGATLLGRLC